MTRLAFCLLLLATGASARETIDKQVRVVHDDSRAVTCYLYSAYQGVAISCIPDSQLAGEQRTQDLAGSQSNNTSTPTRWNVERYSL